MLFFLSIIVSFNEFIYSFINIIFLCNCLNVVIKSVFFFFFFLISFNFCFVSVTCLYVTIKTFFYILQFLFVSLNLFICCFV